MKGQPTRSYLVLFSVPGRLAFCAAGFVARSGGAMTNLGIVWMVRLLYGSYGWAGAVAAANGLAWAAGNAILSRLVDRYGQNRVMVPAVIVTSTSMAGLIAAAMLGAPIWLLFLPSIISGATGGSASALVRARWNHALSDGAQLHAAFALESTLDEITYMVGPLIATVLATSVHPAAGLMAPVLLSIVGGLWFYQGLRASQPPVGGTTVAAGTRSAAVPPACSTSAVTSEQSEPSPLFTPSAAKSEQSEPSPLYGTAPGELEPPALPQYDRFVLAFGGMVPVIAVAALFGCTFGALDLAVVAGTTAFNHPTMAGVVLAAMSLSSALAGLAYGARVWKASLPGRFVLGVAAFAALTSLYLLANNVGILVAFGFIGGAAVAPSFTNANTLVASLVPRHRLTEGLAWIGTSIGLGASLGSAVAGQLIDAFGYRGGFLTGAVAAAGALVIALAGVSALSKAMRSPR